MPRIRRLRILGRVLVLCVATWILLELGSLLFFERIGGVPFEPAALSARRALRLDALDAATEGGDESASIYERHPYLGYVGRPGARPVPGRPDAFNPWGMLSFRRHPYPYRRAPDDFVVGVLGGSVAENFANKAEVELQRELEMRDPAFASRRVVLLSLATGGFKEPQQLFHLQYALLSGFEFDLVVNLDGFNDLALSVENARRGLNPLFPSGYQMALLGESVESRFDPATLAILARLHTASQRERAALRIAQVPILRYSPFVNLLSVQGSKRARNEASHLKEQLAERAQERSERAVRGPRIDAAERPVEAAARFWAEASMMIDATCRAFGIRYIHLLQPNQYVKDAKPLSEQEERSAYDPAHSWGRIARAGYPALRRASRRLIEHGVEFHDLSLLFAEVEETLYTDTCCHVNDRGNALLARALAERIAARAPVRSER